MTPSNSNHTNGSLNLRNFVTTNYSKMARIYVYLKKQCQEFAKNNLTAGHILLSTCSQACCQSLFICASWSVTILWIFYPISLPYSKGWNSWKSSETLLSKSSAVMGEGLDTWRHHTDYAESQCKWPHLCLSILTLNNVY